MMQPVQEEMVQVAVVVDGLPGPEHEVVVQGPMVPTAD